MEDYQEDPAMLALFGPEYLARQEAEHLTQMEREDLLKAFGRVFDTEDGKKVLWWLLEQTHPYSTSFNTSGSLTYFKEGERHVGLKLLGKILEARPFGLHDLVVFKRKKEIEE
jgi:hypothetical protein